MAKFMYLFRSYPTAYRSMSPEQMQQTMKKWMDWKDSLARRRSAGYCEQLPRPDCRASNLRLHFHATSTRTSFPQLKKTRIFAIGCICRCNRAAIAFSS